MYSARYFCPILSKFVFSRQIFVKVPNIKFYENLFSRSRADTCGQTDGRTLYKDVSLYNVPPSVCAFRIPWA
jgi:hypothetical protein